MKIKDQPELIKDDASKAVLNINSAALEAYNKERQNRINIQKIVSKQIDLEKSIKLINIRIEQIIKKLEER